MTLHEMGLRGVAEELYGAVPVREETIGNSGNAIFAVEIEGREAVLRVSPFGDAKGRHVDLELDWLAYLNDNMQGVAGPIASCNGKLWETVQGREDKYILALFEMAPGKPADPANTTVWNETLFGQMGRLMGRMHTLSKQYLQDKSPDVQMDWTHQFTDMPEFTLYRDKDTQPAWTRLLGKVADMPQNEGNYGLIHTDLHHENFFLSHRGITLFDFDDCGYGHYAADIASTCFFAVNTLPYTDTAARTAFAELFLRAFLHGYREEMLLPKEWIEQLDNFMCLRRAAMYSFILYLFHDADVNPYADYASWLKEETIHDRPFIQMDYRLFADEICK